MSSLNFSSSPYIDPEPGALVQRFSWEIEAVSKAEPDGEDFSQLRATLIQERRIESQRLHNERRRIEEHFTSTRSDDEIVFRRARQELFETMKKFQQLVPGQSNRAMASWDDVELIVQDVQAQWDRNVKDTRFGRTKQWLRKMCDGMNNHSSALKLLPSESVYTSLIAGSVSMIIKASANHIAITESFAQGIVTINDAVKMVQNNVVYNTPIIQQLAMRLYAQIFTYLGNFMAWYTDRSRTRFLRSFNENLSRTFQEDLESVKEIATALSQQIQLHMSADVRVSKLITEEISGDLKYLLKLAESNERRPRIQDETKERVMQNAIHAQFAEGGRELLQSLANEIPNMIQQAICGAGIINLLKQQVVTEQVDARMLEGSRALPSSQQALGGVPPTDVVIANGPVQQRGDIIKFESRHFENYFDWDHVYPFQEPLLPTLADSTFVTRLRAFTENFDSQMMYAHCPFQAHGPNYLQTAMASYISSARNNGIPVVSHFCQLSEEEAPENRTKESIELSALLYSMIRQVINLLPAVLDEDAPIFNEEHFSALDGTLRTWDGALSLLADLIKAVRLPLLLLVIDGVNRVEDPVYSVNNQKIKDLIRCLEDVMESCNEGNRICKIIFTTAGISEPLCEQLDARDIVICGPVFAGATGGAHKSQVQVSF